jgi:hypothetical protein
MPVVCKSCRAYCPRVRDSASPLDSRLVHYTPLFALERSPLAALSLLVLLERSSGPLGVGVSHRLRRIAVVACGGLRLWWHLPLARLTTRIRRCHERCDHQRDCQTAFSTHGCTLRAAHRPFLPPHHRSRSGPRCNENPPELVWPRRRRSRPASRVCFGWLTCDPRQRTGLRVWPRWCAALDGARPRTDSPPQRARSRRQAGLAFCGGATAPAVEVHACPEPEIC